MQEITISKSILHILDSNIGVPLLSGEEHPFNSEVNEFIKKHIERSFKDVSIKKACFQDGENIVKDLCIRVSEDNNYFLDATKKLAESMYNIMTRNINIPSCDMICSLFNDGERNYLGLFILNYKTSYIHHVDNSDDKQINKVIKQVTTLPGENQKIDEFVVIDLKDNSILLKEKKYEIDGEKEYYLSKYFLKSQMVLSDKEKIDIINKTSRKIINDYYDGDIKKMADIKTAITESIEENDNVDIEEIKQKAFKNNLELQEAYTEELEMRGITEKNISLNENVVKKIPKAQRLVTSEGIEIKIPLSYLKTEDKVEFINNADGTISVLLKNIREIQDK